MALAGLARLVVPLPIVVILASLAVHSRRVINALKTVTSMARASVQVLVEVAASGATVAVARCGYGKAYVNEYR